MSSSFLSKPDLVRNSLLIVLINIKIDVKTQIVVNDHKTSERLQYFQAEIFRHSGEETIYVNFDKYEGEDHSLIIVTEHNQSNPSRENSKLR